MKVFTKIVILEYKTKIMAIKKTICVAPDKFKGTLSAVEAAACIARVLRRAFPLAGVVSVPLADGGEGTARAIAVARGWKLRRMDCRNALMNTATAAYYESPDGREAIIDSSAVVGLQMIPETGRNVMDATTYPLGRVLRRIVDGGVSRVTVGIGGTATSDGGAGMLQAFGVKFFDHCGRLVTEPLTPRILRRVSRVEDPDGVIERYAGILTGLSDVAVPLLPVPDGDGLSAMSFAWQKGLDVCDAETLEAALRNLRDRMLPVCRCPERVEHAGAGGGIGFALESVTGCRVEAGARYVIDCCGVFDSNPSLVITGEGRLDRQSFAGKVVGTLAGCCREREVPLAIVAGAVEPGLSLPHGIVATGAATYNGTRLPDHTSAVENLRQAVLRMISEMKDILKYE